MDPEKIFSLAGIIATLGWIVLIFLPFWKKRDQYVLHFIIVLLAVLYSWIIITNFNKGILNNFSSLAGVSELFSNRILLLAGWVHYLAFDLLAGIYIIRNAAKNGIQHWLIAPALLLTFLFGPFGFLLYSVIKWIKTKSLLSDF
jgi:hypothetical protein